MRSQPILIALVAFSLAGGCTSPNWSVWQRWEPPAEAGLSLHPVSGGELLELVRSADASAVLVNVWATWCTTCREEFPDLLRLRRVYRERGLAVVFLSGDFPSEEDAALAFLHDLGVDFPTYLKSGKDMDLIEALHQDWSGGLPATFVYDSHGKLSEWWEGRVKYEVFAAAVERVLDGAQ